MGVSPQNPYLEGPYKLHLWPRQSRILRQPLGPVFVVAKWLQVPIGYNQWGQMDRFHEKLRGWSSSIVPVHTAPWIPRVDFWGSTGWFLGFSVWPGSFRNRKFGRVPPPKKVLKVFWFVFLSPKIMGCWLTLWEARFPKSAKNTALGRF